MEILAKTAGNVDVMALTGRLDAHSAKEVEQKLNSLITEQRVRLVINLERLEYISSSGLRILLATLKTARKEQGDVRITSIQPYVREVFDIAGFTQLFKLFDKEEDAINSYEEA